MADWTTDAVDTLENVVATVRDKTVVPAQKATKAVVFGLLVAFFVLTAVLHARHRAVPRAGRAHRRGVGGLPDPGRNLRARGSVRVDAALTAEARTRMPDPHELVIVGSGPAGLTAAVYAGRANLAPIVIEGIGAGGQLMLTTDVENYPGFPDGILGPELMMKFREQAERFGAEFVTADADRVDLTPGGPSGVWVGDREFRARSMIITTGATARMLGPPDEQRLLGHGVSTCATCDGFFFREKPIAVVGGGDSAIEEAIFLTKFATTVTIIHRRDELRASKIMQDRAFANPKIEFVWNSEVERRRGRRLGRVGAPARHRDRHRVRPRGGRGCSSPSVTTPNTSLFRGQLDLDENGYIITARRLDPHVGRGRVRRRRRAGPRVPPGDHRGGFRVHGRDRSRALARRARRTRRR